MVGLSGVRCGSVGCGVGVEVDAGVVVVLMEWVAEYTCMYMCEWLLRGKDSCVGVWGCW